MHKNLLLSTTEFMGSGAVEFNNRVLILCAYSLQPPPINSARISSLIDFHVIESGYDRLEIVGYDLLCFFYYLLFFLFFLFFYSLLYFLFLLLLFALVLFLGFLGFDVFYMGHYSSGENTDSLQVVEGKSLGFVELTEGKILNKILK